MTTVPTPIRLSGKPDSRRLALDSTAREIALALTRALLPAGERFPAPDERTIDRIEHLLASGGPGVVEGYARVLRVLDHAPRATHGGRRFTELFPDEASRLLDDWFGAGTAKRNFARLASAPPKLAYFDDPDRYAQLGCTWRHETAAEEHRWMSQVVDGVTLDADEEIDCDVVVIGTGAGGAVMAKELAEAGHAVLMVEEGAYFERDDFDGGALESIRRLYRSEGTIATIGNTIIPIPLGRTVGGSTTINSGTCFRTPEWILDRWSRADGLADLTPDRLAPYFERVEAVLQTAEADARYVGGVGRVIARGADTLGYSHRRLVRNAPDCDGAGTCEFGCPTGAKRSTNVSYVPLALERGAMLYTGVSAQQICIENGRATGIVAQSLAGGHTLRVHARATVVSCGALMTPVLLQRNGLGRGLPVLGRNLSIHPAAGIAARFDEEIRGYNSIPQGYLVDEFQREGFMLEGATMPIDFAAMQFDFAGDALMDLMENCDKVANFGVMVIDRSRGRVRPGPAGRPMISYWLGRREREILRRGTETVARIFLAAGAREVFPPVRGHRVISSPDDLARLGAARTRARDWMLTAYHPLGTARMSTSPERGVVSPDQEVFGVQSLFVADGSVLPGSPAVNPQVSIMGLATRAADRLAARLDAGDKVPARYA